VICVLQLLGPQLYVLTVTHLHSKVGGVFMNGSSRKAGNTLTGFDVAKRNE
jgi:hypothetical protein